MKRALILVSMLTLLFAAGLASEPEYFIVSVTTSQEEH